MKVNEIAENISHTAKRIHDIERKHKVKPGTEEWFKLWFSLPYLKESADEVYDILDNVECGPFDGGCVLVAQALQQIHGGDIVVLVNDNGIADHAAVKVGNNLIDFDGALPVNQFVKRFEDNEHTKIKSIRPIKQSDLPEAPRDKKLVPQLVNALTESTLSEGYRIQLERGTDMDVLHIVDTKTGKRTEVRGKPNYEVDYDPSDPLHQLLDKIGKAANISELINGEVTGINTKHPDGAKAKAATDRAFNEDKDYMRGHCHEWALKDIEKHPERKLYARIGVHYEDDREEVDHVFTVDPKTGKAYDVRGEFATADALLAGYDFGADEVFVDEISRDDIDHFCSIGELKPLDENFADGKKKGKSRPGRVKRAGASCKGSVSELRRKAKKYGGEKGKMYHWCANMKAGKKK